jgi:hypothetical protein
MFLALKVAMFDTKKVNFSLKYDISSLYSMMEIINHFLGRKKSPFL